MSHHESGAAAVEVIDLVKRYPKSPVNAVEGIAFAVAPGEVFRLLRPNGAGKTTTVGMLTRRVRPTSGRTLPAALAIRDPDIRELFVQDDADERQLPRARDRGR